MQDTMEQWDTGGLGRSQEGTVSRDIYRLAGVGSPDPVRTVPSCRALWLSLH